MEDLISENWPIVTGCERLTPGCDSCPSYWEYFYKGIDYTARFSHDQLTVPLKKKETTRYTVALGSDLFHESICKKELEEVFAVIHQCHWHWFEISTKRAERMYCITREFDWPENLSLSVSVESFEYKWRINYLRKTGAKTKIVSMVPLLGDMGGLSLSGIDLVGVAPETWGEKRWCNPLWISNIEFQCKEQGVAFTLNCIDFYKEGVL